jgi:phosphotransferase system HPr (HPr) family protein
LELQREIITVKGKDGLHARPAAELAQLCKRIKSSVMLEKGGSSVSGKSIIGIMSLGASRGDEITAIVDGDDEMTAIEEIKGLLDKEQ